MYCCDVLVRKLSNHPIFIVTAALSVVVTAGATRTKKEQVFTMGDCNAPYISISVPLNDMGGNKYISPETGLTGFSGGLYPNGSNVRPVSHDSKGVEIANQIQPIDQNGQPDPVNGKIGMVSLGMSNTMQEFSRFIEKANADPQVSSQVTIVNGAQGGQASSKWLDLNAEAWNRLDGYLSVAGITPNQVQVFWVKQAQFGFGVFPQKAIALQNDLEQIARNIKSRYPNVKIAFYSSRTRAYTYWEGLSPEPDAFETGFAVKWLIEKQIDGDPELNYDPANGAVKAPFLAWSAYLWIDGLTPRSDGMVWTQDDVDFDCTHPSDSGEEKVGTMLLDFFKSDSISAPWFVGDGSQPPPRVTPMPTSTPQPPPNLGYRIYIPMVN